MSAQHGTQQAAFSSSSTLAHDVEPSSHASEHNEKATTTPQTISLVGNEDPLNWSLTRKWLLTLMVSSTFLNCTLASSMANAASKFYIQGFGASQEVAALVLSLYMLGFALGPLLWAPLSEALGRKVAMAISMPCFALINVGCALSNDMATLLVFAGFFGGCPQSTAGATIADVWSPAQRAWPMLVYTFCAFGGPVIGPMAGGFLSVSGNWRWIYWLLTIFAGVNSAMVVLLQRETYSPLLIKRKLKSLGQDTAARSGPPTAAPQERLQAKLFRSFAMLFNPTELPLLYPAVWTGWSYALLFIFFEAYPVIYGGTYGFNAGESVENCGSVKDAPAPNAAQLDDAPQNRAAHAPAPNDASGSACAPSGAAPALAPAPAPAPTSQPSPSPQ